MSSGPIITLFSTQNTSSLCDDSTKCTNPLANQSSSQATCAARRCGWLHKRLGRCLPTSLSPGKIGCSSTRSWRSHAADRRAPTSLHIPHTHTHTYTHTHTHTQWLFYCISSSTGMKIGCLKRVVCVPLQPPVSSPNQGKTLTLMASQVGQIWGGNCAALAGVMYCLLLMAV